MRYAVLADVHANLHALDAVLAAVRRDDVDGVLCAGDLVGYGAFPNECVDRLRAAGAVCVAGNHDLIATGRLDDARSSTAARESLRWTRGVLRADSRRFLAGLPLRTVVDGMAMAHGSLDDPEEYVGSADRGRELLARLPGLGAGAGVLVLGHTHEPWALGATLGTALRRGTGGCVLPRGEPYLLNPGSVGQSRDVAPHARYLVLDLDRRRASFRAVRYDLRACRAALRRAGLPPDNCHAPPTVRERLRRAAAALPGPLRSEVGRAARRAVQRGRKRP